MVLGEVSFFLEVVEKVQARRSCTIEVDGV
jgi:hypothetical protein